MALTDIDSGRLADNVFDVVGPNKNRIINGDMRIDQRNAGASVTNPGTSALTYTLDRWAVRNATDAAVDVVQSTDVPSVTFSNSIQLDVTTADATIAAGQVYSLQHRIEGFNVADLAFGQAGSRNLTISFWHKHTKTGTYCVGITNSAGNRAYPAEYSQSAADTWEQATITIPVDTSGTWLTNNGVGLLLYFVVAAGSNFHGTVNTWAAANTFATSNQVNALDSTSNFFRITGVQLEVGSVATPFEHRSYGDELARCQRYYQKISSISRAVGASFSTSRVSVNVPISVPMRATPSFSGSISQMASYAASGVGIGSISYGIISTNDSLIGLDFSGLSVTDNTVYWVTFNSSSFSAEL